MILSATSFANDISCVTRIIVFCIEAMSLMIFRTPETSSGSSADVGSSKVIILGP